MIQRMQKFHRNGEFCDYSLCPELQGLLKPIYDLTRKGRGEEQQKSFDEIK